MLNGPTASTIPSNPARLLRLVDLSTDVSDQVRTESRRAGFGGPMSKSSPFLLRRDSGIPPKLFALGVTRRYGKGELVYQQGQWSTHFYVVVSGRVRIFLTMPDGTERVLCYAESGASFGESACFDCLPYYVDSVAMTACEIRVISRDAVLAAVRDDPQVVLDLAAALSRKTRVLVMHLATTGMRAGDRVALLLDQLIGAYGVDRDGTVRLVIRHSLEELARMIGVTRVTVSRELSRLAALGIVEKDGWDIVVLDPDAIQRHVEQLLS